MRFRENPDVCWIRSQHVSQGVESCRPRILDIPGPDSHEVFLQRATVESACVAAAREISGASLSDPRGNRGEESDGLKILTTEETRNLGSFVGTLPRPPGSRAKWDDTHRPDASRMASIRCRFAPKSE
jgi:hypothetical protein